MNALFLGLGSIGQRHLRNLHYIDKKIKFFAIRKKFSTPLLTNKNQAIKGNIKKKYKLTYFNSLESLKKNKTNIDIAFICTPSNFHVDEAIWLVKNNINIFVEKPLGSSLKNVSKLKKLLMSKSKIKHMMGYQLKFNPIILKLKNLLKKKIIGDIWHVNIHHGENIDDFHPYEGYEHSYAARKDQGGGVILCQIHEIDYLMYLFKDYKIKIQNSYSNKITDLKINVEDSFASTLLLIKNKKKTICNIHLNFYERPKKRTIEFLGKLGKITCNLHTGDLMVFKNNSIRKYKYKFDRNKIFIKQMNYFLNAVKKDKKIKKSYDVINGISSLKLALQLKKNK
jgi:predicted dehydrogenase